ncbi:MAG: hypothetical protein G01um101449_158 [Parcubacteria group bacterium Gr01-1014_49]|nr:MAG: hypothetical protein G01um101449_158 [Parcubacteria group bacterium Gr01-1014_49]
MTGHFSTHSFIAGLMLGAFLSGAWFLSGNALTLPTLSSALPVEEASPMLSEGGSVAVHNQPSGDTVIVESVTVAPPGVWVAVREVVGDELGNVLGAARINGPRSNVPVSLLRATEPGHSYAVQLYRDDGNGVFDVAANSVYVDFDTGARVVAYFSTTE